MSFDGSWSKFPQRPKPKENTTIHEPTRVYRYIRFAQAGSKIYIIDRIIMSAVSKTYDTVFRNILQVNI